MHLFMNLLNELYRYSHSCFLLLKRSARVFALIQASLLIQISRTFCLLFPMELNLVLQGIENFLENHRMWKMNMIWIRKVTIFWIFYYNIFVGVVKEFRQNGIASFLLENLIAHMTSDDNQAVKAMYLHVLTTNIKAISFYEHRGFR